MAYENERKLARAYGGRRQRGSGCSRRPSRKGDVVTSRFLIEEKTTERPYYRLTLDLLKTHRARAVNLGLTPLFVFVIQGQWLQFRPCCKGRRQAQDPQGKSIRISLAEAGKVYLTGSCYWEVAHHESF